MDNDGDLQQQTLPLSHSMIPLHGIEDLKHKSFHHLRMGTLAAVPPGHVSGSADNIVVEIMPEFHQLVVRRIFGGDPVTEADSRNPQRFCPCDFHELFIDNSTGKKQGRILCADSEFFFPLVLTHPEKLVVKEIKPFPGNPLQRFSVILMPEQIKDIFPDSNDMMYGTVRQIHFLIIRKLVFRHAVDQFSCPVHRGIHIA